MEELQGMNAEVCNQADALIAVLRIWQRPVGNGTIRRAVFETDMAGLSSKLGRERRDHALHLLDQLETLLYQCSPSRADYPDGLSLGDETHLAKEKFKVAVPDVPDEVMSSLTFNYMRDHR